MTLSDRHYLTRGALLKRVINARARAKEREREKYIRYLLETEFSKHTDTLFDE